MNFYIFLKKYIKELCSQDSPPTASRFSDIFLFAVVPSLAERFLLYRIQVSKGHHPHVLAHMWMNDFLARHNMSIKVGR